MRSPNLKWLQDHPYVQAWRDHNVNSYLPTVDTLNDKLNVSINNPITPARVDSVVQLYLDTLENWIRKVREVEPVRTTRVGLMDKFGLNRTECAYIISKLNVNN